MTSLHVSAYGCECHPGSGLACDETCFLSHGPWKGLRQSAGPWGHLVPVRCLLLERGCGVLAPSPLSEGRGGIAFFEEQFWPEPPSPQGRTR